VRFCKNSSKSTSTWASTPSVGHRYVFDGNVGYIENSKPAHLVNLFSKYPDVKFILFHGAYPYGGEIGTLAKKFRNVYIDLCWLYIISPSFSERYLHEWLETVPASKIMAFGGDFLYVENIYSHLLFAKQIVSNVLTDKVKDGYLNETEALKIAQMLFHDNAIRILNLTKTN
jgi:predicted TIM-barrel fold metal-dependent hydrolase